VHSNLIARISAAHPKAIGYDVLFAEPSRPSDDIEMAQVIAKAGNVVLPSYFDQGANGRAFEQILPIPPLRSAAKSVGYVNVTFDSDGLVRRSKVMPVAGAGQLPHMMEALVQVVTGKPSAFVQHHARQSASEMLIPFHRGGAFRRVSAAQLARGEIPGAFLKDKIVLVGATAAGLGDTFSVPGPAGGSMSGIEVQANLLTALMHDDGINAVAPLARLLVSAILVCCLLLLFWWLRPANALYLTVTTGGAALALSAVLLTTANLWFAPGGLICSLILAYPLWSWRRLAALNSFVETETRNLTRRNAFVGEVDGSLHGLDSVAAAAASLKSVIGELQCLKTFMAGIIEDAPDALSVVDDTGHIQLANLAAKSALGEACEGRRVADLLNELAPGSTSSSDEIQLSDGRVMLIKSVPLQLAGDVGMGSILRMADITDRRLIEQEREDMLAFLSHDMRGPQAAIIALLNQQETMAPPEQNQRIRVQAEASLKLADNFVQLARLSKVTPVMEPIDLCALLDEAIDQAYPAAQAKQVLVKRPSELDAAWIDGDGWTILRALNNIISNAIRYSPVGGTVSCTVSDPSGRQPDDQSFNVMISDSGPGMSEERQASLFEKFGTADPSAQLSAGLGLSYVKKVIDLHGGKIECQSSDRGTCFILTFNQLG
jgi:signal transduction histidine kinase